MRDALIKSQSNKTSKEKQIFIKNSGVFKPLALVSHLGSSYPQISLPSEVLHTNINVGSPNILK